MTIYSQILFKDTPAKKELVCPICSSTMESLVVKQSKSKKVKVVLCKSCNFSSSFMCSFERKKIATEFVETLNNKNYDEINKNYSGHSRVNPLDIDVMLQH